MIEGHGDDLYRYGDKVKYNFSTNIISDMNHAGLFDCLTKALHRINSYPEPSPFTLEREIAEHIGVSLETVVVTNGATDAMYRIAHHFSGSQSAIIAPTFREYQDACRLHGHKITFFKNIDSVTSGFDLVWICNPNNPTGNVWDKEILLKFIRSFGGIVVLDQAYADYTERELLTPVEAVKCGNVILLSSLTKRFAVPGLRIGYSVASGTLSDMMRGEGMPWSVNTLAIEAGSYLLKHADEYRIDADRLHEEALRIAAAFEEIGIECSHTDCNFILCRLPEGNASDFKEFLVDRYGILIRDAFNFEGLDSRYFRVAAQHREENDLLINGVRQWIL